MKWQPLFAPVSDIYVHVRLQLNPSDLNKSQSETWICRWWCPRKEGVLRKCLSARMYLTVIPCYPNVFLPLGMSTVRMDHTLAAMDSTLQLQGTGRMPSKELSSNGEDKDFSIGGTGVGARGHVQWFCKDSFVSPCDWGSTVKLSLFLGFDGRESGVKISWRLVNVFGKNT